MIPDLVSEQIRPRIDAQPLVPAQAGAPVVPSSFEWRGETHVAVAMLEQWKESSPCSHGSDEIYLRKHWYRLRMKDGGEWVVYFLRQPQRGKRPGARWWLYTRET
ncbi:cytoplasmic protein [bacterium]|nr:cytoplasmic protein [bacterium]